MRTRRTLLSILSLLTLSGLGCGRPPVDDFRYEGGAAPDPTGIIQGTILYVGPRPSCALDDSDRLAPIGRVLLTLFHYDNPPPPTGQATTAENLLTIPGQLLFPESTDCADPDVPDDSPIMRSVEFTWPEIPLGIGEGVSYQIRGFYDMDGDFNPFFSVTNLPTAGDVGGGAVLDVAAATPTYLSVDFGSRESRPTGEVRSAIAVTLGRVIQTERPYFWLESGPLSSTEIIPHCIPTSLECKAEIEAALIASTNATIHLFPRATASAEAGTDCASLGTLAEERVCERCGSLTEDGQTLCDPAREDCKMCAAMAAANLSAEMDDPFAYAWYLRSVDADGDGIPDVHPILGPSAASYEEATKWITPMVILKRQRSALEQEAGIPETLLIPAVSLSFVGVIGLPKRVTDLPVPLMIPPVAAVQTHPTDAACRIPYLAPGNSVNAYQRITSECQELPTGLYSVNVLQGVAGGEPLPEAHLLPTDVTCVGPRDTPSTTPPITVHCPEPYLCLGGSCILGPPTNTGWDISADGLFSSQAWSIPNELGYADADSLPAGFELLNIPAEDPQIATEFAYPSEQGYAGMFIVHDADPSSLVSRLNPGTTPGADCVQANDLADGLDIFVDLSFPDFLGEGEPFGRTQAQQREYCCAAIMHLCDVPLCPAVEYGPDGLTIYGSPSSVDADGVPNCVPFEMPGACCGATP